MKQGDLKTTLEVFARNSADIGGALEEFVYEIADEIDGEITIELADGLPPITVSHELKDLLGEACENLENIEGLLAYPESVEDRHDVLGQILDQFSGGLIKPATEQFRQASEALERHLLASAGLDEHYIDRAVEEFRNALNDGVTFNGNDGLDAREGIQKLRKVVCALAHPAEVVTRSVPAGIIFRIAGAFKDVSVITIDLSIVVGDSGLITLATAANSVRRAGSSLIEKARSLYSWFKDSWRPNNPQHNEQSPQAESTVPLNADDMDDAERKRKERKARQATRRRNMRRYLRRRLPPLR